jgi:Zn-dependent peptidase ImmA (M78 family)
MAELDYPEAFFRQNDTVLGFGVSSMFHRKRQSVGNRALETVCAQINVRRWHIERLFRSVDVPEARFPTFELDEYPGSVEDIAREVRAAWRLPPGPISNVTATIENAGGIVIPFRFPSLQIDAISEWPAGLPPLFFINQEYSGDRLRFTECHEVGHLVMHHWPNPEMERQADRFAAEFLMPERDIRPDLDDLSLPKLVTLKEHWKVSMSALLKRAGDLGTVSPRHARTLWMMISKAGFRTKEPIDIPVEEPVLFRQMIDVHRKDFGYTIPEFMRLLNSNERDVQRVYFSRPTPLTVIH